MEGRDGPGQVQRPVNSLDQCSTHVRPAECAILCLLLRASPRHSPLGTSAGVHLLVALQLPRTCPWSCPLLARSALLHAEACGLRSPVVMTAPPVSHLLKHLLRRDHISPCISSDEIASPQASPQTPSPPPLAFFAESAEPNRQTLNNAQQTASSASARHPSPWPQLPLAHGRSFR